MSDSINSTIKIGVVIPVLNQFEMAIKALESIETEYDFFPVIIPQWDFRWPLARAWNVGIYEAIRRGATHILVINDDILFAPYTIDNLVQSLLDSSDYVLMVTGCNKRSEIEPEEIREYEEPESISLSEAPDYSCFMVRNDFLVIHGVFDENFTPAYREDNDSHYRIKLLGYKAISTTAAPYYHYGSATQNADPNDPICPGNMFDKGGEYYRLKWGGDVGKEIYSHPYNNINYSPREWSYQ